MGTGFRKTSCSIKKLEREDDSLGVVKRLMERQGIPQKQWSPKVIAGLISDAKNALVAPAEYESLAMDPVSRAAAKVYKQLEPTLKAANAVSFDDLLVLPVEVFRKDEKTLAKYRDRFQFILVDEYQDTNRAQFQFIKLLGSVHGNVVVVGDDDQSIYGWRGADIRNILDFEDDYPGTKDFEPLKNATGDDSPETVRGALIHQAASWLEQAGVTVPRDPQGQPAFPLEVSPLLALDAEELQRKVPPTLRVNGPLYLSLENSGRSGA